MAFEYVYANDMGRALDLATTAQNLPDGATYNISWGRAITFDELVDAVKATLPALEIEITPGTPPNNRMTIAGYYPRPGRTRLGTGYSLEEALAAYAGHLKCLERLTGQRSSSTRSGRSLLFHSCGGIHHRMDTAGESNATCPCPFAVHCEGIL